jgi:hypothetical protein
MKTLEEMADIVELQTWASGKPATLSAIQEQLESALDIEDQEEAPEMAQKVSDEFLKRQQLLGDAYPFKTDGEKLEIRMTNPGQSSYLFCLGLSLLPHELIENEQRALQFETMVMAAAKEFFGGQALRIGAPWQTEEITEYGMLLDKVIDLIPVLGTTLKRTAPGGGDAGWDILIVKGFRDNTFPWLVALGNCATGRTNWLLKGMEAQPTLFWNYFQSRHCSTFITFFAAPFVMDHDARLRKLSDSCLTFDRFRICENVPTSPLEGTSHWLESHRNNALQIELN